MQDATRPILTDDDDDEDIEDQRSCDSRKLLEEPAKEEALDLHYLQSADDQCVSVLQAIRSLSTKYYVNETDSVVLVQRSAKIIHHSF